MGQYAKVSFNSKEDAEWAEKNTGNAFTGALKENSIKSSMDGKGRCMDNIFIERLCVL